jgi:hypothetical protein
MCVMYTQHFIETIHGITLNSRNKCLTCFIIHFCVHNERKKCVQYANIFNLETASD